MNDFQYVKNNLKKDWYVQGFNAVPLFLGFAASSGLYMKNILGYGYQAYLFIYHNDFGEMHYVNDDFIRIYKIIKNKLKTNPRYLIKVKNQYDNIISSDQKLFLKTKPENLKKIPDTELLDLLKKLAMAQRNGVGIAHVIDAIGIISENELKNILLKQIKDKKNFNKYLSLLSSPTKYSYVSQEENDLIKIIKNKSVLKQKLLKHLDKYQWVQNSFAGPKNITIKSLKKRIITLNKEKTKPITTDSQKKKLMKKLKLPANIKKLIRLIDFTSIWQDQRKANGMKNVHHLGLVIDEISRRLKISTHNLYYLGTKELLNLKNLDQIKKFNKDLVIRRQGCFILQVYGKEIIVSGKGYKELDAIYKKTDKENQIKIENEIHGSIANIGTAIGRVIICRGISSIKKVKSGDILVASMTRPEYMPAMKKAAAIVTDEGGITCHAAIVSRELNIPCVIGAKIATKILKDGMIVQVKANHGIVKIIK